VGDYAYEANLRAGMQILDVSHLPSLTLMQVGSFDVDPSSDSPTMNGAWSVYPFWDDNIVTISDTEQGLFVTQLVSGPTDVTVTGMMGQGNKTFVGWIAAALLLGVLLLVLRLRRTASI